MTAGLRLTNNRRLTRGRLALGRQTATARPWWPRPVGLIRLAATLLVGTFAVGCSTVGFDRSATGDSPTGDVYLVAPVACIGEIHVRATAMAIGDDLVATAAHSFEEAIGANLLNQDGEEIDAELVYADFGKDIALLRVSPSNSAVFSSGTAVADDTVRVVSYDDAELGPEIKEGTVLRAVRVTLDGEGRRRALELEADIERGDSGGPVIDDDGNAVAMVFAASRKNDRGWAVTFEEVEGAVADYNNGAELNLPINCDG